jgi:hypothetical protein
MPAEYWYDSRERASPTECGKNIVGACWANDCNLAIFTLARPGPRLGPMYAGRGLISLHNKAAGSQTGGFRQVNSLRARRKPLGEKRASARS